LKLQNVDGEIERDLLTRVKLTGQRGEISKLLYSCVQTSRYWGDKTEDRKLTKKRGKRN